MTENCVHGHQEGEFQEIWLFQIPANSREYRGNANFRRPDSFRVVVLRSLIQGKPDSLRMRHRTSIVGCGRQNKQWTFRRYFVVIKRLFDPVIDVVLFVDICKC